MVFRKNPKYYSRFFRFLVVSLLFVIICLTESGSKSRRLLMRIQMRNVSKRAHTEGRDPFRLSSVTMVLTDDGAAQKFCSITSGEILRR